MRKSFDDDESRVNYVTFDALRGIAALAVVLYHLLPAAGFIQAIPRGYLAVDLFFVLSGYVIAQAYGARLQSGMSLGRFMTIRLVRLYPLFILGQLLGVLALAVAGHEFGLLLMALAAGAVLAPIPLTVNEAPLIFPLNGPAWSLFFELAVNVAFVFLIPLGFRKMVGLCALSALAVSAAAAKFGSMDMGWNVYNFIGGFPRVTFSFLAGAILFHLAARPKDGSLIPLILMMAVLAVLSVTVQGWWIDLFIVLLVFPAVILLAAAWQPTGRIKAVSKLLGGISYPLYIIHAPLLHLGSAVIHRWNLSTLQSGLAWAVVFSLIVILSHVVMSAYDQPIRRALHSLSKKQKPAL
ncbi:acyltransferase family protein [Paracoccus sp. (in: a-proteobacteria)]|uniref:acyltransferase family protein n=1 Tax=Paracoccus sp. TaxID=267 RepID=UPI00396C4C14